MGMSFQAKDDATSAVQLKVQELVCKLSDNAILSSSASTVTIDINESIAEIRSVIFVDDSAGTAAPVVASNRSVSSDTMTLTLSAPLAAADCLIIKYVVSE